jgi:hypothetical protein
MNRRGMRWCGTVRGREMIARDGSVSNSSSGSGVDGRSHRGSGASTLGSRHYRGQAESSQSEKDLFSHGRTPQRLNHREPL